MNRRFHNIRYLDDSLSPKSLDIQDGRIAWDRTCDSSSVSLEEIDGVGKLVTPGFINAHTHLAMVAFRGLADDVPLDVWLNDTIWPLEGRLKPEDVYWCTLLAIAEGIRSGTTACIDMYFHLDEIARAVEESGIRALLSYGMIAPSIADRGRSELEATAATIEQWHGAANGRIQVAVAPHAVYTCGEEVIRAAVELAQTHGVPMHIHVSETRSEVENWIAQTGKTPVAYLDSLQAFSVPTVAAHCVHVSDEDMAILAERDVTVAHCPKSNAKLGSGIAPIPQLQNAGVRVALGTDGAASNNRLDLLEEARAVWLLQRAHHEDASLISSDACIAMAAEGGRMVFGLQESGLSHEAPADLVFFDTTGLHTTPQHRSAAMLAYASHAADVTDVYVDGKPLLKNGELLTIDEERVKSEVQRLLHRIKD